jgi:hypothetical protein
VSLRAEVIEEDGTGLQAKTWREAVWDWRDYCEETEETAAVFENEEGERVKGSDPHRFAPDYADKQYAKLKDLERGLREDYGKRLHTAMLPALTASSTAGEGGGAVPPVDHLNELLASWEAVTRALRRVMEGRRWEYLAILEPHESGYLHVHIAVFVDGPVRGETFAPVMEAHTRNCELAGEEAHEVEDVQVRHVGADRGEETIGNLGTYLAEYLGPYDEEGEKQEPTDAPEHVQQANAVLWSTGRQRWRPSNGAQSYMAANCSESSGEWELVGIEDGDGELHEAGGGFGGVTRVETFTPEDRWGPLRGTDPPD